MAKKAGVAHPYLIICELCELCEQMCRLSIFSGKCLYFQEKIYEIILKFAYIKNCLYLCRRKQYHEAMFHNWIGSLTPTVFLPKESSTFVYSIHSLREIWI